MNVFELTGPSRVDVCQAEVPVPGPDELLLKTRRTAVSVGTEVWRYVNHGHYGGEGGRCGYNLVGEVVDMGSRVAQFNVGDLVFTTQPHAEYAVAPASKAVKLPPTIDLDAAAFSYLPTLGLHALRASSYGPGENVLVVGLGVVGTLAALVARLVGAPEVALEVDAKRRALAERAGAGVVLDPAEPATGERIDAIFGDAGPDVIIETSQSWSGLLSALDLARANTRIAVVGILRDEPPPEVALRVLRSTLMNRDHFHNQRLKIIGCSNDPAADYSPADVRWTLWRNVRYVAGQLAEGRFDPRPLITHRLRWDELPFVYRSAAGGDRSFVGVTLNWD